MIGGGGERGKESGGWPRRRVARAATVSRRRRQRRGGITLALLFRQGPLSCTPLTSTAFTPPVAYQTQPHVHRRLAPLARSRHDTPAVKKKSPPPQKSKETMLMHKQALQARPSLARKASAVVVRATAAPTKRAVASRAQNEQAAGDSSSNGSVGGAARTALLGTAALVAPFLLVRRRLNRGGSMRAREDLTSIKPMARSGALRLRRRERERATFTEGAVGGRGALRGDQGAAAGGRSAVLLPKSPPPFVQSWLRTGSLSSPHPAHKAAALFFCFQRPQS